jgi:hypothetical protein
VKRYTKTDSRIPAEKITTRRQRELGSSLYITQSFEGTNFD